MGTVQDGDKIAKRLGPEWVFAIQAGFHVCTCITLRFLSEISIISAKRGVE
jgi:hypothetical protein